MSLTVLVADPNHKWVERAADFLRKEDYKVEVATNGKNAQLGVYNTNPFAVILNLNLKNHSGTQVLKFIQTNHSSTKVILLMNHENSLESAGLDRETLSKQGIIDIYQQPVEFKELLFALEGKQDYKTVFNKAPKREGAGPEEEVNESDDQFSSIRIDEFLSGKSVQFDIFVKLNSGRYIKILHAGDSFAKDRIQKYKEDKGIKYLYFRNEDRKKFLRIGNYTAQKVANNPKVSTSIKLSVARNVAEKFVEEAYTEGLRPQVIEQGTQLMSNIYDIIHNSNDLAKLMRNYEDFDPSAYNHSYLVSLFSCMIIKQFEWDSKIVNETVGMGALLHDLGRMKLSEEVRALRPKDMNEEQLNHYKEHPQLGLDVLKPIKMIPPTVKQIIYQHHERIDASGFPLGIKGSKILTLAKIVGLADEFSHVMEDNKLKPPQALKLMLQNSDVVKKHSSAILENFIKIFVDQPK